MTKHHKQNEEIDHLEEELTEVQNEAEQEETDAREAGETQAEKITELQAEVDKLKDLYMRSQAEMENLRRRTQLELEKRSKFAISSFAQDLLPVNDNLSRAIASIPADEKNGSSDLFKNLMIGLELTQKELDAALEKNQVTAIESVGKVFDPNWHKVVQEVDDPTKPAGTIIQEWQKGYLIGGDRVLREAVVVVTKGGPKSGEEAKPHIDTTA